MDLWWIGLFYVLEDVRVGFYLWSELPLSYHSDIVHSEREMDKGSWTWLLGNGNNGKHGGTPG